METMMIQSTRKQYVDIHLGNKTLLLLYPILDLIQQSRQSIVSFEGGRPSI